MQVARTKWLLWLTAAAGAAGAAACLAAAVLLPLDVPPPVATRPAGAADVVPPTAARVVPLEEFERAWAVNLRRPLVDPPAAQLAAGTTAPARPTPVMVRLVGTIVDGERARGVFLVGLATIELKGVGDKAGGAEILRIDAETATLSFDGRTFVLKREKNPFDPTGGTAELPPI